MSMASMASLFFFSVSATTEIYTLSLHDALPISQILAVAQGDEVPVLTREGSLRLLPRSEEHTSELQSPDQLVCRLLLEKKNRLPGLAHERGPGHPLVLDDLLDDRPDVVERRHLA